MLVVTCTSKTEGTVDVGCVMSEERGVRPRGS